MESINKTVIVYLVFVLPILFWIYPSFGQNEMRNANLPLQKYRLNVSAVCPNDTNRFWRVTDDLYCQIEIAKKRRHRILPIVGYENASHAHFSTFTISVTDLCPLEGLFQYVYLNDSDDSCLEVGVRCYKDCTTQIVNAEKETSTPGHCLSICEGRRIGNDSVLTTVYVIPQDVNVATLRKSGCRYFMSPLTSAMDECGAFILSVPKNKESLYAFYNTQDYVCLIRFFPLNCCGSIKPHQ